jgi:protein O-mannosyl-transferase
MVGQNLENLDRRRIPGRVPFPMCSPSPHQDTSGARSARLLPILLVAAVAVVAFLPGLRGGFVFDDHRFVEDNEAITSLSNAPRILVDPRTAATDSWEGIFRPLRTLSFAVDHALWDLDPTGYHVQSLLWHILAAVMLLALLLRLGFERTPSTVAALIFAAHPVQAESVVWISSRGDVMSGALVLLTLYLHAGSSNRGRGRGLAVAGVGLLAMLSKEVAIVTPALVIILDVLLLRPWDRTEPEPADRRRRVLSHALRAWAPIAAAALIYFVFRQWRTSLYAEHLDFGHITQWWGGAYLAQLCVSARGLFIHVASLLLPIGARLDYYPPADDQMDGGVLLALLVLAGILVLVVRSWRSRPVVSVGLIIFLLALLPVSNILFTVAIANADRFLYLPLAALMLAAVPLLRRVPLAASAALVVLLVALSISSSGRFRDDATLWANGPERSPHRLSFVAEKAYFEIVSFWDDGRRDEARSRIPEALAMVHAANDRWRTMYGVKYDSSPSLCTAIADLHRRMGHRREAFHYLREAVDIEPDHPEIHRTTAFLLEDLGDPERALLALMRARELGFKRNLDHEIGRLLTLVASEQRDKASYGRAMTLLRDSLSEWPEDAGNVTVRPVLEAFEAERKRALAAPPPADDDFQGWFDRAVVLGQWGEWDRLGKILGGLREALPDNPQVIYVLARWGFEERGDLNKAGKLYGHALSLDPKSVEVRLGMVRCGALTGDLVLAADPALRLKLIEGLPCTPQVLVERALALRQLWRGEEAQTLLETAAQGRGPGVIDAIRLLWEEDLRAEAR